MNRALADARVLVFDLDGTLVDSLRDLAESANALLAECGAPPITDSAVRTMVGGGAPMLVARVFAAAGIPPPPDAVSRYLSIYEGRLLQHTRPYPGVRETLELLRPGYTLAVLTNKPIASTRTILEGLDLARFFQPAAVLGGDGPFPRKPDPTALLHLASQSAARPREVVLVGDSAIDWRTARAAGSRACLVTYGFGFHSVPKSELADDEPTIERFGQLQALL